MKQVYKTVRILAGIFIISVCLPEILFADVILSESTTNGLSIAYRPSKPSIDTLQVDDKTYHVFNYDGHAFRNMIANPLIPTKTVFFAAPEGITPVIRLLNLKVYTRSNIKIAPNPRPSPDGDGFATYIYEEDPTTYAMSGYKPRSFVKLGKKINKDGIAIWELILTPLMFDARKSMVAISDSFDVKIDFGVQKITKSDISGRIPDYIVNHSVFTETAPALMKKVKTDDNPFSAGEWYKITLIENGIYYITGAELAKAGFLTGNVLSDDIHMYYGGGKMLKVKPHDLTADNFREIAIKINDDGDGKFDTEDKIIFYGQALSRFVIEPNNTRPVYQNYPYAEDGENAYWLLVSNENTPLRMGNTGETISENINTITTYRELIHIEQENYIEWIDEYKIESGINWYWASISTETEKFSFKAPGIVPSDTVAVRIGFQSGKKKGEDRAITTHSVGIMVNNEGTFSKNISTNLINYCDIVLNEPIKTDNNILNIWRKNGTSNENIRLDWFELNYEKNLIINNNKLEFFITGDGSPAKFKTSNASSLIEIYETTDPYRVKQFSIIELSNNTVTFQSTIPIGETRRYTFCTPDNYLTVSSISKKSRTNLRNIYNGADYIIITHNNFIDQANKLANWRSIDSKIDPLRTMVVDVYDIYDEFAWGIFDPAAIRDFLKFTWENNDSQLKYCCLFGDAIFKYKNLSESQIGKTFIPTYTAVFLNRGLATDDYYTWFDTNNIPYIAIGRLCVNDKESAEILVDKIIEYERNPENGLWHNRVLLIPDDEFVFQGEPRPDNLEFTKNIENIDTGNYIPESFDRKKIYMIEYPIKNLRKPDVTEVLIEAFNEGYIIMNYIGHGNNDVLAVSYTHL
ncbi:MAG TPA: hypothetical protein ENH82_03085, partial [bacterium]|nr:hypothetical protein [bacterium]